LRGIPSNLPYPGTFGVLPSKKRGRSSNSTPEQRPLFTTTAVSDFCAWLLLAEGVWKRVWKTRLSYVVAMSTVLAVVPVQRVG